MTAITLSAARLWHKHPRGLTALGAVVAAATIAAAGAAWSSPGLEGLSRQTPPAAVPTPPPLLVRNVAPEQALTLNQQIPLASGPNPAALPFVMANASPAARAQALECLTSAAYYEAGNESDDGLRAVAQVVLGGTDEWRVTCSDSGAWRIWFQRQETEIVSCSADELCD